MTSEYQFGNIIRPRSRFMTDAGDIWSCQARNASSALFCKCHDDGSEIETVPSEAIFFDQLFPDRTDAEHLEIKGFQPLLIPDNMLICHCQFRQTERPDACYDCDDLGLIHAKSRITDGFGIPEWIHVIMGPKTTVENLQAALIDTIARDLFWADFYAKIQGTLSMDAYTEQARIQWERMTTLIELGYGFDGMMTGREWHSMSSDPLPGDPLYDEWVAFNTPDENDRDPYDDCPGIAVMAQYI